MTALGLAIELISVFLVLPALYAAYGIGRIPLIPVLWVGALACISILRADETFDRKSLWNGSAIRAQLKPIALRFTICSVFVAFWVAWYAPEKLFDFPQRSPLLWGGVMVGYPIASVYAQEIIWRTFFFHRYRSLLPDRRARIAASAIAFGYAHMIFHNWIAVLFTLIGGWFFAATFDKTRSTAAACLDHALLGCLMFTVGLGTYFYSGAVRVP
ncbi:MAG: CPBP family glutamic-type intramembrane protease [Myxococcota bacterium]